MYSAVDTWRDVALVGLKSLEIVPFGAPRHHDSSSPVGGPPYLGLGSVAACTAVAVISSNTHGETRGPGMWVGICDSHRLSLVSELPR